MIYLRAVNAWNVHVGKHAGAKCLLFGKCALLHIVKTLLLIQLVTFFCCGQGGEEQYDYCTDNLVLFRQESYFAYLFGVKEPGFSGALDIETCEAYLFIPRLSPEYAIWSGEIHSPSYYKDLYKVDAVFYVDQIKEFLTGRTKTAKGLVLYLLHGLNTDSNNYSKPAHFEGIDMFEIDLNTLHPIITECRVIKSHYEIDLLRFVNKISSNAHVEVMRAARPGMKEYHLESLFLHSVYMKGGCRYVSYTCVCATGKNSSTLHYGHVAAPNDRTIVDGDMALLDMGAEYHFYDSDITCSFPVNGIFTEKQRVVYEGVLDAQKAVIAAIKPGVSWIEMHKLAESIILGALVKANILTGRVEAMLEKRLGAIFMPHGLGHFLGLDTHDPGGYLKGAKRPADAGLKSLRTARTLEEGMVITVEPGCYFINSLIDEALKDQETAPFIKPEEIEKFRGFGGVRLEDDVVVTVDGCENLTNCPREVDDVEAVMAGKPWPLAM
ncbi:hypothetical protein GOP47_0004070 [Adiantum capillus-veneris]|uniref:Xaa-Pro dipeptidase n=1 Tax=Adiantum capillus-veneris TaxID=13818 RepID=A0A9D4ZP70_ADICA|nr:hypothetical protein GOP47_0004070 [Adiantum capillus-veneris]